MTQILQKLVNTLEGNWISQKTIYDFTNKRIKIQHSNIDISLIDSSNISYACQYKHNNNKQITYNYISENHTLPIIGKLEKVDNDTTTEYIFTLHDKNNLKTHYYNKNILYTEYTYFIHENFRLSVVVIKKENKYIAICFNSDIKIIQV